MKYTTFLSALVSVVCCHFHLAAQDRDPSSPYPGSGPQFRNAGHPYNVLFIMVDDLRPELGCYGKPHVVSPNIDRLAKMGQVFEKAYASMPSCGPSRASLLSGLYPSQTRFRSWNCSQDRDVPGIVSLPMHLHNNGYQTVSLGKVYNNFEDGKGSWDLVWKPPITTTEMWDYQSGEAIRIFFERNSDREADTARKSYRNVPKKSLAFERPDVGDLTYGDGRTASKAIEMLQGFKHAANPFFLAVGFNKPHLPFNAPEKYWELYDRENIEHIRKSYASQTRNVPEIALHNSYEIRGHQNIPDTGSIPDSTYNTLLHGYLACVSFIDFQIGRIINSLEHLGMAENTIIVLWGDHGWHLGENEMWGKATNFSVSSRIPLIFKVPGQPSGIKQDGLIESVDIYPTLCDVLGLSKPFHLQGKSFAKKIGDPGIPGKDAVFIRMYRGKSNGETVITDAYSYTEFIGRNDQVKAGMLYDLRTDPRENINIAGRSEREKVEQELAGKLHQHIRERDQINLR